MTTTRIHEPDISVTRAIRPVLVALALVPLAVVPGVDAQDVEGEEEQAPRGLPTEEGPGDGPAVASEPARAPDDDAPPEPGDAGTITHERNEDPVAEAPESPAGDAAAGAPAPSAEEVRFEPLGYVETYLLWSFSEPSNGLIAYRGFDNRHATFTIQNAVLGGRLSYDCVYVHVALQWGHAPASYYAAEPDQSAGPGTGASTQALWQALQETYVGWDIPLLEHGLRLEGGLFLSPVGIESLAVHDNWNWSRSNLFFGLPFYHTGLRVSVPLDAEWTVTAAAYNGWNTVLDNNDEKSVSAAVSHSSHHLDATLLYLGGVEADPDVVGRGWRSLFDLSVTVRPVAWLDLQTQLDAGFEPVADAVYSWFAGALYARVRFATWIDLALRGDFFFDGAPSDASGARTSPLFWPAEWVSSQTATITIRPIDHLIFRVEYRHDEAAGDMFFSGTVGQTPDGQPILNAVRQDTLTFGLVGHL